MEPIRHSDFSGAMIDVNVNLAPENTVGILLNMDADIEIGSIASRLGTATIGAQLVASMNILGLWQHIDTANSSNNKLFATVNAAGGATSVIYDVIAGTTSVTGLTASKKMRFLTYGGATLAINGSNGERSYTASGGWITTGGVFDLANFPTSNTAELCIEFLDRIYAAGDSTNPSRLFYSSVYSGSAFSWTSGNGYVDIEAEDAGGPITALAKVPGYILVFKERSMHRWNFSSAFPESLVQIGTPSQESVIMAGGLCAFYSNSNEGAKGFYVTNGDRPKCISSDNTRPIKKFIDAISSSNEADIAGWATDKHFCWSVGDLSVDGETYTNCVLRYNRLLNQWSVRTYPQRFMVFGSYLLSGVNTTVGGGNDGTIYRMDKPGTYVDASTTTTKPFPFKVRTLHKTFGDMRRKTITEKLIVRGKNLGITRASAYVNEDLSQPIAIDGKATKVNRVVAEFQVSKDIKGNTIALQIAGESNGSQTVIREIEIPNISVDMQYT
jgi:hypothetical protein